MAILNQNKHAVELRRKKEEEWYRQHRKKVMNNIAKRKLKEILVRQEKIANNKQEE